MSMNFEDLDLSSMVDEMESMISELKPKNHGPTPWINKPQSRVTASGFTDSTAETVSELPKKLTQKEIADRAKLARDVSSLVKHLDLNQQQYLYCDDLIHRFSNKNAYSDDEATKLQDMQMINTLSALSTLKMRSLANEVQSDVDEMKDHLKSMIGLKSKRRDSVLSYADTTRPEDSASQVTPRQSTRPLTVRQKSPSVFSDSTATFSTGVIGGYKSSLTVLDEDDDVEVAPVLGLPKVFVNDELNFLCHLHKPLRRILTENGEYPCDDICGKLSRFMSKHRGRDRDPEDNLLYMVIRHTFSLSRMQIRRNFFKLPMIEEGMFLNEQLMYMCVEQLYTKFNLLWFNSMKAVEVPDFHDKYSTRKAPAMIRRSTNSTKKGSRSMLNF